MTTSTTRKTFQPRLETLEARDTPSFFGFALFQASNNVKTDDMNVAADISAAKSGPVATFVTTPNNANAASVVSAVTTGSKLVNDYNKLGMDLKNAQFLFFITLFAGDQNDGFFLFSSFQTLQTARQDVTMNFQVMTAALGLTPVTGPPAFATVNAGLAANGQAANQPIPVPALAPPSGLFMFP
jgi:hypothetical protein